MQINRSLSLSLLIKKQTERKEFLIMVCRSLFKHTKVIPLFKKGCPKDVSNYRPFSLLSCFSKIIEKLVYIRLYSFLNKFNLISKNQFSFRRGHSTCHLTSLLTDQMATSFEEKNE